MVERRFCTKTRSAATEPPRGLATPVEGVAIELKTEGPDLQAVADGQLVGVEAVPIDEVAGGAVQVGDHAAAAAQRRAPARAGAKRRDRSDDDVAASGSRPMMRFPMAAMRSAGLPSTTMSVGLSPGGGGLLRVPGGSPRPNWMRPGRAETLSPAAERRLHGDLRAIDPGPAHAAEVFHEAGRSFQMKRQWLPRNLHVREIESRCRARGRRRTRPGQPQHPGRRAREDGDLG